jgi:hypothetical protein
MPQYAGASFASILDKGTLDALLCGDAADADAGAMLGECWRLLAGGGAYLMVTSAAPRARLPFLQVGAARWLPAGQRGGLPGWAAGGLASAAGQRGGLPGWAAGGLASAAGQQLLLRGCTNKCATRHPRLQASSERPWDIVVYEVGQQGACSGPFSVEREPEVVAALPAMAYSHFAYVCTKP